MASAMRSIVRCIRVRGTIRESEMRGESPPSYPLLQERGEGEAIRRAADNYTVSTVEPVVLRAARSVWALAASFSG